MGLFHHDSGSKSNHTCPNDSLANPVQEPLVNGLSFHQVILIVSGACMAFSCLLSFYLIFRHATHYSIPKEQKQIIRIIFTIPVFAVVAFLSVAFNDAAIYLKPIEDLYEAFALASFFVLLCAYVQEGDEERNYVFATTATNTQFMAATIGAFQFPVVMLLVLIVTEITEATGSYCATSNKLYFAKIWLTLITLVSTTIAIFSILKFYKVLKPNIDSRKPLSKLMAFKGIVFLNFLQNAIFSFLTSSSDLKPTTRTTFKDLSIGVPNLILSLEMVIFALAFLYVYRTQPYYFKHGATAVPLGHGGYSGGFLGIGAIIQALNIVDIVRGIIGVLAALTARKDSAASSQGVRGNKPWVTDQGKYVAMDNHAVNEFGERAEFSGQGRHGGYSPPQPGDNIPLAHHPGREGQAYRPVDEYHH